MKLGREIGFSKAAKELGIHTDTLYGWNKREKDARLDLGAGSHTPGYRNESHGGSTKAQIAGQKAGKGDCPFKRGKLRFIVIRLV